MREVNRDAQHTDRREIILVGGGSAQLATPGLTHRPGMRRDLRPEGSWGGQTFSLVASS